MAHEGDTAERDTLDDWPRVKRILEGALAWNEADRAAYVADVCGTDAVLRARVDRLLAAADHVDTFLETPAALVLDPRPREDLIGRVAGSYQLLSRLGAGGMGEVFLAHDSKLDRPVALKFLSPELAANADRLRRFDQEARAASSLNHPHIVVVHDFGELDGRPYIVTEFIEGETLRQRLRRGPLPMPDVVDIGVQIAGALAAAHDRGLVHRDVKPENIMVRPDGYAKVLDFGIAEPAAFHTPPGIVLGTPHYMSPEQARGLDLDARSDVWSLGVVLYEIATGALPLGGTHDLPPRLDGIIRKALQPARDLRYESAGDMCADLKDLQGATRHPVPTRSKRVALSAVLALSLGALVSVALLRTNREAASAAEQKPLAHALYLKSLAISADPEPNREAIAMLERAIVLDPTSADTWSSLADRYYWDGHYGGGGSKILRQSEAASRQALAVNPAHTAAMVRLFNLHVEAGRLQDGYDSAMKLVAQRPSSGEAHFALSYVLRYGGLLEESARACEDAVARDPTNSLFRTCAQPLMLLGRYDCALDFVRLDTGSEWAKLVTRLIYQRMGRRDDARAQHDRLAPEYLRGLAPERFYALLARCLSSTPDTHTRLSDDDVGVFLSVPEDPEPLYFWASDLAYCGDTAPAVQLLRESIRRNFCAVSAIEIDPTFAAMRDRPEYGELLTAAQACRARFSDHVNTNPPPR